MGALVAESLGCAGARSSAAPREVEADVVSADRESQLPASAPVLLDLDAPADQRIASLVAELAAVVERASTEELLSAERLLARRGLPGLGLGRALAAGSGRAAQLATGVAGKVVSALASPKRQVARFARGLRAALSGHGAPPV